MDLERATAQLIAAGGDARSKAMAAVASAKKGDQASARACLAEASKALAEAHRTQAGLIQDEAAEQAGSVSLLMVHAQDHLMNAITVRDLAAEFVDLYASLRRGEE